MKISKRRRFLQMWLMVFGLSAMGWDWLWAGYVRTVPKEVPPFK